MVPRFSIHAYELLDFSTPTLLRSIQTFISRKRLPQLMLSAADLMRNDFVAVEEGDAVSGVLAKIRRGKTEAIITKDGKFLGMFDKRALLRTRIDPAAVKVQKSLNASVPKLSREMDLREVARLLYASDHNLLPVVDKNGHIEGAVGARHLLASASESFQGQKVSDVVGRELITLKESEPISKLMACCRESHISHVPVVDAAGKLSGVVSVVDVLSRFLMVPAQGSRRGDKARGSSRAGNGEKVVLNALQVSNVMTRVVQTVQRSASLNQVIATMHTNHISDLIVVEKDVPIGIVTTKDLLKFLVKG